MRNWWPKRLREPNSVMPVAVGIITRVRWVPSITDCICDLTRLFKGQYPSYLLVSSIEHCKERKQASVSIFTIADDCPNFFKKNFGWGHWYPCFGLLVMSFLVFKARVDSLIRTWHRHTCYTFPRIHLWCKTCWLLSGQHGIGQSKLYFNCFT